MIESESESESELGSLANSCPGGPGLCHWDPESPRANLPYSFSANYSISKTLGTGGFATVKEGIHRATNRKVAIKIIDRATLKPTHEAALNREIRVMRQLDHDCIVKLYDVYEDKEYYRLVCELCEGGDLFDRIIAKRRYSENEARDAVRSIVLALDYCHSKGIVHRDLKPENLLLVSRMDHAKVKIADFGMGIEDTRSTITQIAGTPHYMAPEMILGLPYGKAVDSWSLGVITYVLLSGCMPFDQDNKRRMFRQIVNGNFQLRPAIFPHVSYQALNFITRLLDINPKYRLTAKLALHHPWLQPSMEDTLRNNSLDGALPRLVEFNAVRGKFKDSVFKMVAANRMMKLKRVREVATSNSNDDDEDDVNMESDNIHDTHSEPQLDETDTPPQPTLEALAKEQERENVRQLREEYNRIIASIKETKLQNARISEELLRVRLETEMIRMQR